MIEYENAKVRIIEKRWHVFFEITTADGKVEYVASSDSAVAESGIFFGTKEEYEEAINELW